MKNCYTLFGLVFGFDSPIFSVIISLSSILSCSFLKILNKNYSSLNDILFIKEN